MGFLQFGYYDGVAETPSVPALDIGANAGRVALVHAFYQATATLSALAFAGEDLTPAIDSDTAYTGGLQRAYGKAITATGSQNLSSTIAPGGPFKTLLCAIFDGVTSIRSATNGDTAGSAGALNITVATEPGDIVVVMGSDFGVYDIFTATGGAETLAGSLYFIGAQKTATTTSTTVTGTFAGGSRNHEWTVFVLVPVATAPTVSTQPTAQSVTAPAAATFPGAFSGTASSVQWKRKAGGVGVATNVVGGTGATILGAGTLSYTTGATSVTGGDHNNTDTYGFVLQPGDVESTYAALTVTAVPTVATQPSSITVTEGSTALFTAAFNNTPTSFAWEFSVSPYSSWSAVTGGSGATTTAYTTAATTLGMNARRYRCTATNAAGNVTTNGAAELTVNAAGTAPNITVQPANQTVTSGTSATFSVTATGTALTYQWYYNGVLISGAVSSSYTTPATSVTGGVANSGDLYSVVVTGSVAPAATSSNATLTVNPAADTTIPVFNAGTLAATSITAATYTLTWPTATDNVAVTGYEYSVDSGLNWVPNGTATTVNITGRVPGVTDGCRVRAFDAAGNRSATLSTNVSLLVTAITTQIISNGSGTPLATTLFNYTFWPGGRIGSISGVTPLEGTVTSNGSGVVTIYDLPPGLGVLMLAYRATSGTMNATTDKVYYEALVPA